MAKNNRKGRESQQMIYSSKELAEILSTSKVTLNKYIREKNIKPTGIVKTKTTPAKGYDISLFEKFMDKHDMTDAMTYAPREVPKNVMPLRDLDRLIFKSKRDFIE